MSKYVKYSIGFVVIVVGMGILASVSNRVASRV
jgi:hypothetical protein